MRFAIVTCERPTEPDSDFEFLRPALKRRGVTAEDPAWTDEQVEWGAYDLVLISSTWDYTGRVAQFRKWVRSVARQTRLVNAPELIEWNIDKRYLRELAEAGVATIPTIWCEPADREACLEQAERNGWEELIVKPVVDLGAERLARVPRELAPRILEQLEEPVMIQPYLDSLETEGEQSLIFIGGSLAHAVRKVPARGDFRVQPQYGGTHEAIEPVPAAVACAEAALACAPGEPAYARVDLVENGGPQVIELELIEPALYVDAAPASAELLVRTLLAAR